MHMHAAAVAKKIIFVCNLALTCERNFLITETLFWKIKFLLFCSTYIKTKRVIQLKLLCTLFLYIKNKIKLLLLLPMKCMWEQMMQLLDIYVLLQLLGFNRDLIRQLTPHLFLGMLQRQEICLCGRRGPFHSHYQKPRGSWHWKIHLRCAWV